MGCFLLPHKAISRLSYSVLLIALAVALGSCLNIGPKAVRLPRPTGELAIGRTLLHWVDFGRPELFSPDVSDNREIMAYLWYPCGLAEAETKAQPWMDEVTAVAAAEELKIDISMLKSVSTNSIPDAPVLREAFPHGLPILIMSHGDGGSPLVNASFAEEMASHGYAVLGLFHVYNSELVVFPDGRRIRAATGARMYIPGMSAPQSYEDNVEMWEKGRKLSSIFAKDVSFALDKLEELSRTDVRFKGSLDFDRVGVFGHSLGGAVAFESLRSDQRVKAAINLDGSIYTSSPIYQKPIMLICPELPEAGLVISDDELAENGWTRQQADDLQTRYLAQYEACRVSPCAALVAVRGTEHNNYTDMGILKTAIPQLDDSLGKIDAEYAHEIIKSLMLEFFAYSLNAPETTMIEKTRILRGENPYPAAQVERGLPVR